MRIRVQSASTQPLELVLSPDLKVKHVKEMMLSHDFPREVHLIEAGRVLADTMPLSELIEDQASSVWALLPSHALASVDFDLKDIHRIVPLGKFQMPNYHQKVENTDTRLVRIFVDSLLSKEAPWTWQPSEQERLALDWSVTALEMQGPVFNRPPYIAWYEHYGCALLFWVRHVGVVHLELVGLDCWSFSTHSGPEGRTQSSQTACHRSVSLQVGTLPLEDYPKFLERMKILLELVEERRGNERSAAFNRQGHQKTPSFIQAIIRDALETLDTEGEEPLKNPTKPRGGFTDVGLHTGGHARDTSWPMVRAVLQVIIEAQTDHHLFLLFVAQFHLRLAECGVASIANGCVDVDNRSFAEIINAVMTVLSSAVLQASHLITQGLKMAAFEARCVLVRFELEQQRDKRMQSLAKQFVLPSLSGVDLRCRNLELKLPRETVADCNTNTSNRDMIRKRVEANSGWLPAPPEMNARAILSWVADARIQPNVGQSASLLALRTVERFFFQSACESLHEGATAQSMPLTTLRDIVLQYRLIAVSFRRSPDGSALMRTELLSRELLVVWTAACLVHKETRHNERLLQDYAIPLDPCDLVHLVLSERLAIDAMRQVVAYLRDNRRASRCVFSMREIDSTFEFARFCAEASSEIKNAWEVERATAIARAQVHRDTVVKKQKDLRRMDEELENLKVSLQLHKSSESWNHNCWKCEGIEAQIQRKKAEIERTEIPPDGVLQPLPRDESLSMQILFFLQMPVNFQVLSHMLFMAQQMLLPETAEVTLLDEGQGETKDDINRRIMCNAPETVWRAYYLSSSMNRAEDTQVELGSCEPVPKKWYPGNVRQFNEGTGIWYPDDLKPKLFWRGGNFTHDKRSVNGKEIYFNPFYSMPTAVLVHKFTETLPEKDRCLQWAMEQHCRNSRTDRGNVVEARQNLKPSWLRKSEFLTFGAMRAYPNQQIRKVLGAMHDRSLVLDDIDHPTTRLLLLQTLYQIGDLSEDMLPNPIWRTDLQEHGGWEALCAELKGLMEELRYKQREHTAVKTFGEIATHASQWHEATRDVARDFAKIMHGWETQLREQMHNIDVADQSELAELRARRSLFCMYAVVCHGLGSLREEDIESLCELIVLADYCRLSETTTTLDNQLRALTVAAHTVTGSRITELLQHLDRDSVPLTSAVRLIFEKTPAKLNWKRAAVVSTKSTTCYEAVSDAGNVFTVNILTGAFLFDGLPPRRLPVSITNKPLYQRTFGDLNFEVVQDSSGVLTTTRSVRGRHYSFSLDSDDQLIVHEQESNRPQVLLLLDGSKDAVQQWGADLPVRLKEMHSHWYYRCGNRRIILLRPLLFENRDVHFFLVSGYDEEGHRSEYEEKCNEDEHNDAVGDDAGDEMNIGQKDTNKTQPYVCFRVPKHMSKRHWIELTEVVQDCGKHHIFDRLMIPPNDSVALRVLSKFETQSDMIHVFYQPDEVFVLELPRYELSFEFDSNIGSFRSKNFNDFVLSGQQQLDDALFGFKQYLILESKSRKRIIIPHGIARGDHPDGAYIHFDSDSCDAIRMHNSYDVHPRFGLLQVAAGPLAVLARLQLAALYVATGTELPELRSCCTGGEMAVELVRQCWGNHPLTLKERKQLDSISELSNLTPTLPVLCYELDFSSRQLKFLHSNSEPTKPFSLDADAATEYVQRKQRETLNPRVILSKDEEMHALAHPVRERIRGPRRPPPVGAFKSPQPYGLPETIRKIEGQLQLLINHHENPKPAKFPLESSYSPNTELGQYKRRELFDSWSAHQEMCSVQLTVQEDEHTGHHVSLCRMLAVVKTHRSELEVYLLRCISHIPGDGSGEAASFIMRRAANLEPLVSRRDLARAAVNPEELRRYNPLLSALELDPMHTGTATNILNWLELCVLEDQLDRMCHLAADLAKNECDTQELERELGEIGREWDVRKHPEWLVFEVEQRLKIRRHQYKVTQFLIDNPSSIFQLNMGEGKTRVILPILYLYLGRASSGLLLRMHFLSQLLGEAYHFLHRHLTASLLCRRLCELPFHRQVDMNLDHVESMYECLKRCMESGSAVLVAPEHRLSLQLKWQEVLLAEQSSSSEDVKKLNREIRSVLAKIDNLPFYDVLDESDEVLNHKYQLIYAVGNCLKLPAGDERWVAAEALLLELQRSPNIAAILAKTDVSRRLSRKKERGAGSFDDLRLLPGKPLSDNWSEIINSLAAGVVDNPPRQMRWLKPDGEYHRKRDAILVFVTDRQANLYTWLPEEDANGFTELQMNHLLALRGFLACGLFEHCLTKRHRVDYGVDVRRGDGQRMAVPYCASETPADRSEFAQPDIQIMFTLLSYYHQGLTRAEIREAVFSLLKLGPNAQGAEYALWLDAVKKTMTEKQVEALDSVDKLDLTSEVQLSMLHEVFQYDMSVISFWLNCCVLPRETMQFPHRLVANAFNLTDNKNGNVVGFSGTKDNHLLLPLHVKHELTPDVTMPAMLATDGKMFSLVLKSEVKCLESSAQGLAHSVLEYAVSTCANALIDAGATMTGIENAQVAEKFLDLILSSEGRILGPRGVVYFGIKENTWLVRSRDGATVPLGSSPIHESEAFVFFDESRCRGADMKLKPRARAVVTISPQMCKDKLMQAAGRMRKLDRGQTLTLLVPPELVSKIFKDRLSASAGALHILTWIMDNTVSATAAGLPIWAAQGSHFCTTQDPRARLIEENLSLKGLYSGAIREERIFEHVEKMQGINLARIWDLKIVPEEKYMKLMNRICEERARPFGSDQTILSTGLDEECERELENERELEREIEKQLPHCKPQQPREWNFRAVLELHSPTDLPADARVMPLAKALRKYVSEDIGLSSIRWEKCKIFVTKNYMKTVMPNLGALISDLGEYLRPVDVVIVFPSEECLLLSEWEADQVLMLIWKCEFPTKTQFVNLCNLREAADSQWRNPAHMMLPLVSSNQREPNKALVNDVTLAGLQLLAGETMFGPHNSAVKQVKQKRLHALSTLLPTPEAKAAALKLPALRGLTHMISLSDLENFCDPNIGVKCALSH